jgi:lysyl-tRNA synthetase class 2
MSRPDDPETTLERIMQERREKARALAAAGSHPYRNDIAPSHTVAAVRARYEPTRPAPAPAREPGGKGERTPAAPISPIDGVPVRVAGRVIAKRGMGKTVFAPIRDGSGDLQLYLNVDHLAAGDFEQVIPLLDTGDIVAAEGPVFWTQRGELSVLASRLWIVTKSLRPLPSKEWVNEQGKHHGGLADVEQRYRQRYVDLAINPEVREVFRKRSAIVRGTRAFLDARDYLEVETPMMHPIIGGAAARPFRTHHNALDLPLYLRIAPELYLKRLVVGGFERVYEINRNFRNEGLSRKHNPEFTMLELYTAYATYTDLIELTEALITELAREVVGRTKLTWDGVEIDLAVPWRKLTVRDAVREVGGVAEAGRVFDDAAVAAEVAIAHGVSAADVARALFEGAASPPRMRSRRSQIPRGAPRWPRRCSIATTARRRAGSPRVRWGFCCSRPPPRASSCSPRSSPSCPRRSPRSRAARIEIPRSAIASSCLSRGASSRTASRS